MSVQWVAQNSGDEIPQNAIRGGQETSGEPFFIARAISKHGGKVPGKVGPTTGRGALFATYNEEEYNGSYEVLVGDESAVRWVDQNGAANVQGVQPVEGGIDTDGAALYIAKANFENGVYPGKAAEKFTDGAHVGYGGKEVAVPVYQILAHA